MLSKEKDPDNLAKIKRALHLLRQREASARDRDFRKKAMKQLQTEQVETLQSGKRVKFMRRGNMYSGSELSNPYNPKEAFRMHQRLVKQALLLP
ncbi:unnamed protein product [Echinostoma caproni]|uniref:PRP3 domain-containing protein n=1 Tax=Echinostoma caproni TaxID=27848 RepID=A0A183BCJ9_9TREM|nr:unnamed protein product [Echinostoma caproni]